MDCINTRHFRKCVLVAAAIVMLTGCCDTAEDFPTEILAGTSLIADIVADLTDASVSTYTLLPSSSCPSQFDMKAGDIKRLQQAGLILLHPWQLQLANITRSLDAAKAPGNRVRVVEVPGNWMLPEAQTAAVTALAAIVSDLHPDKQHVFHERAEARRKAIMETAARARGIIPEAAAANHVTLCNEMQAPFVQWLGFDVADTYARPEDWSVAEAERLVALGKERGATLIIDNLQSGGLRMSATLARDIGAVNVVLSNFPNGFPGTPTWEAAFMENINRVKEALARIPTP